MHASPRSQLPPTGDSRFSHERSCPALSHSGKRNLLNRASSAEQYYGFYKNVWTGEIVGLDHVTMVFFAYEIIYCTAVRIASTYSLLLRSSNFARRDTFEKCFLVLGPRPTR